MPLALARRSFRSGTSTRCSSGTTATARRRRKISASIRARSFGILEKLEAERTGKVLAPDPEFDEA